MGILSRMSTIFKAKVSRLLDAAEDPRETLEYSYERQLELLRDVKRGIAEVVTSKKRVELQATRLRDETATLEQRAREAVAAGREDLARAALERRELIRRQLQDLEGQIAGLEAEQQKLEATEQRLRTKVEAFRTQKELIRARYSAAEAQVKIGEAVTGLSEELADVGMAVERAQEKTERMRARAAAIDELVERGVLEDRLVGEDDLTAEVRRASVEQSVEEELRRLRGEVGRS
ncbi:MAG: PspA/IM30 family protein [Clostridia bacterium]|nr:PspA/IM30 family protein [Clostridia bacterium]